MTPLRALALSALVLLAVVLQAAVLSQFAVQGVVPDLVLIVVVAIALVRGPEVGAVAGFLAGLMVDLAPPADHAAGQWALALLLVGFLAGRLRSEASGRLASLAIVGASSFLATSVFALGSLILNEGSFAVGDMVRVIGIGVALDLVVALIVLPPLLALVRRLRPARLAMG